MLIITCVEKCCQPHVFVFQLVQVQRLTLRDKSLNIVDELRRRAVGVSVCVSVVVGGADGGDGELEVRLCHV